MAAGLTSLPQLSGGVPQGYLRLLVFSRDSALVSQQVQQLTAAALNSYDSLRVQVVVPQDGYVTAYVGNASEVDVLFDDVRVEHRPGVQVQEVQYDPAGLELAGLAPPSPGIKGLNNYRFNGKEFQPDLGLSWNHQDWRFFDPQLLRWHAVDPEVENGQESWTPCAFGFDNAVRYEDADGRAPGPGDPPTGEVLPAPGLLRQMWRDITNPNDFKHFLNDSADFPLTGPETRAATNLVQTLTGLATLAGSLPTPKTNTPKTSAPTLPSDKTFVPPTISAGNSNPQVATTQTGPFSVSDWTGYPNGSVPKSNGPLRVVRGEEYKAARQAANAANSAMHKADSTLKGKQVHEVHPVKLGGSPIDPANKVALTPKDHAQYTTFWNRLLKSLK